MQDAYFYMFVRCMHFLNLLFLSVPSYLSQTTTNLTVLNGIYFMSASVKTFLYIMKRSALSVRKKTPTYFHMPSNTYKLDVIAIVPRVILIKSVEYFHALHYTRPREIRCSGIF